MFENGKVYKIEVTGHTFLNKVERGYIYKIYVDGDDVRFLKPRGRKVLFRHKLKNANYSLYDNCTIEDIETIEDWRNWAR